MSQKNLKQKISELENDPWHAHVLHILKQIHGDPLPELIEHGFVETIENGNVPQKQMVAWVGNYNHVGETIVAGNGSGSDFSVFWIRLYEILDFLPEYFELFEPLNTHLEILKIVREIRGSYSIEEQVMIEYQRNCHAHIHQTGYRIKANYDKGGRLKDSGLYYKGQNKLDLKEIINSELKKYSIDEKSMAVAYFKKAEKNIQKLWESLKKEFSV